MQRDDTDYILSSNVLTSMVTLLVWDLAITFQEEVNGIWMQPWTIGTAFFFVNRYSPFVDMGMAFYMNFNVVSAQSCEMVFKVIIVILAVGLGVSELIILLRTWAIYHRSRTIGYILLALSAATYLPGFYVAYKEIEALKYKAVPVGAMGCMVESSSTLIVVPWFLLLASQTVIIILTMLKGKDHMLRSRQSWVKNLYQQGLAFYILLSSLLLLNIIVPLAVKSEPHFKQWLTAPLRVFHSVFANRVILHISRSQRVSQHQNEFITSVQINGRKLDYSSSHLVTYTRRSEDGITGQELSSFQGETFGSQSRLTNP